MSDDRGIDDGTIDACSATSQRVHVCCHASFATPRQPNPIANSLSEDSANATTMIDKELSM